MPIFSKTQGCPPSHSLLSYLRGDADLEEVIATELHLESCDFCNAELQMLRSCRYENEEYASVEIPPHLYRLAIDLLQPSVGPLVELSERQARRELAR